MSETKLEGDKELIEALRDLGPEAIEKMDELLGEEGEALFAEAQTVVPVESGDLRASGFVDHAPLRKTGAAVTVGYEIEYAAAEHEGIHGGRHDSPPPRWLEKATDGRATVAIERVYEGLRDWIGE